MPPKAFRPALERPVVPIPASGLLPERVGHERHGLKRPQDVFRTAVRKSGNDQQ